MGESNILDTVQKTDDILYDIKAIIETSQNNAYRAINTALIFALNELSCSVTRLT